MPPPALEATAAALEALAERVGICSACPLADARTQAVPGAGPAGARVLFIGEGPGYHEDRQGLPFVGPAGQLLNDLLAGAGLGRDQVFITNIVKCRPPGNRDPKPEEIEACRPYLEEQIALLDPEVVVTLGRFALDFFIPGLRIGQAHGRPRRLGGRTYLPMVHPAAALHRQSWRPALDEDFAALKAVLDAIAAGRDPGADEASPDAEQLSMF